MGLPPCRAVKPLTHRGGSNWEETLWCHRWPSSAPEERQVRWPISLTIFARPSFNYMNKNVLIPALTSISSWFQVGLGTIWNIMHKLLIKALNDVVFLPGKITFPSPRSFSNWSILDFFFFWGTGGGIIPAILKQGFTSKTVLLLDVIPACINPTAA